MEDRCWVVRNGQLICVLPPVREGKKEILGTVSTRLEYDRNVVTVTCGRKSLRLTVTDTTEARECADGDYICTTQGFVVEHDGDRLVFEFMIEMRLNEAKKTEISEQHTAHQEREKKKNARYWEEQERVLQLVREKLDDESLIRTVVEGMRFCDHNKLWQRRDRRHYFVVTILAIVTTVRTEMFWMNIGNLPFEEIEEVRIRLWAICENLRSAKKADWLSNRTD